MKRFYAIASKILAVVMLSSCIVGVLAGCKKKETPDAVLPTITVTPDKQDFSKEDTVTLTVVVSDGGDYELSANNTCVAINGDKVTLAQDITIDKKVTITATHKKYSSVFGSCNLYARAPFIEGQVGDLSSDMIKELGESSVTVSGTLTDFTNYNSTGSTVENKYQMTVKMEDGKWSGSWYVGDQPIEDEKQKNVTEEIYLKGEAEAYNVDKEFGNVLLQELIDKDNKLSLKQVTNYISYPVLWDTQHYWNHFKQLNVNKFKYDVDNDVYEYQINHTDEHDTDWTEDDWLMTYMSYSLTPLLSDTLYEFYFKVQDGKITKLIAKTETLYDNGESTVDDYNIMSYSTIELTISDIGTTTVADLKPYEAPTGDAIEEQAFGYLQSALEKMSGATNYTFYAVNTTTYAPVTDSSEYELDSVTTGGISASTFSKTATTFDSSVSGGTSATGTVGQNGYITEDAILFADTGKYDYSLDDKLYYTNYSGYKNVEEGYYDYFEYDASTKKLVGQRKYSGSVSERIPKFNFSPYVFRLQNLHYNSGNPTYEFVVRDSVITRDLAKEVSTYSYAKNGSATAENRFSIVVDQNGNVVSTTYPYSLSAGYVGYVTTTYKDIGTTTIPVTVFGVDDADYVRRVIPTEWSQMEMKNFYIKGEKEVDGSMVDWYYAFGDAQKYFDTYYTDANKKKLPPSPKIFFDVFGDRVSGVFDKDKEYEDENGETQKRQYWSLTAYSDDVDENGQLNQTGWDAIVAKAKEEFPKIGYDYDPANSNDNAIRGQGVNGYRYLSFSNGTFRITIENNFTKNFWIICYYVGDWTLNK